MIQIMSNFILGLWVQDQLKPLHVASQTGFGPYRCKSKGIAGQLRSKSRVHQLEISDSPENNYFQILLALRMTKSPSISLQLQCYPEGECRQSLVTMIIFPPTVTLHLLSRTDDFFLPRQIPLYNGALLRNPCQVPNLLPLRSYRPKQRSRDQILP